MRFNSRENWNSGNKFNENIPSNFGKIDSAKGLVRYLDDFSARTKNYKYIYHYTSLRNLIKILSGGFWHLANAKDMNDQLEYQLGDSSKWKRIYFASFMMDSKESIGMWSMYAQPWETGVKITLPISAVRKWIKEKPHLYALKKDTTGNFNFAAPLEPISDAKVDLKLSAVVYSNADSLETPDQGEYLSWSHSTNTIIKHVHKFPELTGYIKDKAWDYEKEIRLKAVMSSECDFDRIAIKISQDLIDSMIITASPLFEGDLQSKIEDEIKLQIKTDRSIFSDRLHIKTICSSCDLRQ